MSTYTDRLVGAAQDLDPLGPSGAEIALSLAMVVLLLLVGALVVGLLRRSRR